MSETLQLSLAERKSDSDQFETEKCLNYCTLEERDKLYSQTIYFSNGKGKKWVHINIKVHFSQKVFFVFDELWFWSADLSYKTGFSKSQQSSKSFFARCNNDRFGWILTLSSFTLIQMSGEWKMSYVGVLRLSFTSPFVLLLAFFEKVMLY